MHMKYYVQTPQTLANLQKTIRKDMLRPYNTSQTMMQKEQGRPTKWSILLLSPIFSND